MATRSELRAAEEGFRRLLREEGLAPPDEIEYCDTGIACRWHRQKLCVVIDVDEVPEGDEGG